MTIYVVTKGDYSSYHILGCFTEKKLAERVKVKFDAEIEEYEANETGKDNRYIYFVRIEDNHTYAMIESDTDYGREINDIRQHEFKNKTYYTVYVMAENVEYAIKIASDLIAQYKAAH